MLTPIKTTIRRKASLLGLSILALCTALPSAILAAPLNITEGNKLHKMQYKVFEGYGSGQEEKSYAHLAIDFAIRAVPKKEEELEELPHRRTFSVTLNSGRMALLVKPAGLFSAKQEMTTDRLANKRTLLFHVDTQRGKVTGHWEKNSAYELAQQEILWNTKQLLSHFSLQEDLLQSLNNLLENIKNTLTRCFSYLETDASSKYQQEKTHFIFNESEQSDEKTCSTVVAVSKSDALEISYLKVLEEKGYWSPKRTLRESLTKK